MVQGDSLLTRIISAVVQVYDRDSLDQVATECLGERLENRAGNKGFADQVFELLISLDREGRTLDLLHCLSARRQQHELLPGLCAEAEQRCQMLGAGRPLFGGTITNAIDGDYNSQIYQGTDPPLPIPTLADPLREGSQPILVCRSDRVGQLNDHLQSACGAQARQAKHLVVVTGNREAGKRDLLRTWLDDARLHALDPNVAIVPFLPPAIPPAAQVHFYAAHPTWQGDQSRYGAAIARLFPSLFKLGGYPWITLAAQLAGKSERVRAILSDPESLPGLPSMPSEQSLDSVALRRSLTALLRAAASERPLVIILEQAQYAGLAWLLWLEEWLQDMANLAVLFVVDVDTPLPLDDERLQTSQDSWLQWLRKEHVSGTPYAHILDVGRLSRQDIAELLAPSVGEWALDLYYLSEGSPVILRELLAYWRNEGKAVQGEDGRWHLRFDPHHEAPGSLTMRLVEEPLRACARRAHDFGYDLTHDDLREWLRLAAWEGDIFTDEALAYAVGLHDDNDQLEAFQSVLDDALCRDEDGVGVLEELDAPVRLATHDLEKPFRYMARYRIVPPVLRSILFNNQQATDRHAAGQRYALALTAAYTPFVDRVASQLIEIYTVVSDLDTAQDLRTKYIPPSPIDPYVWSTLHMLAGTVDSKRLLLNRLLKDYEQPHVLRHPSLCLIPLQIALDIARELHDLTTGAHILHSIGDVYYSLGDQQQALAYYEQALPLRRQVGDKGGEATTLVGIGVVYSTLGDKQQALHYYEQALPLKRQVGDKGGEATTLSNIGVVYSDLDDQQQALHYHNQALPLMRQVGERRGEAITLNNIGKVYYALGDQQQALACYEQALPLLRQMGDKRTEAHILHNIGVVYSILGDKQQALAYNEQALLLFRQVGAKHGEAYTLSTVGMLYSDLGDKQRSLAYYEQALPLIRQVGDKRGEANTLSKIGAVYSAVGDKQRSLAYYEQALPLIRQVGDHWEEAVTRYNLAMVAADLGDLARAEEELQTVVAIDEATGHPGLPHNRAALERMRARRKQAEGAAGPAGEQG